MTISSNCQTGELIQKQSRLILRKLNKNRFAKGMWFVITTAKEESEMLYVLSKRELQNGLYDLENLRVLGLAGSKQEAFFLIEKMIQEACDAKKLLDLKQYFMEY